MDLNEASNARNEYEQYASDFNLYTNTISLDMLPLVPSVSVDVSTKAPHDALEKPSLRSWHRLYNVLLQLLSTLS